MTSPDTALEATHRDAWGRLLALLVARTRRLDLVEDALAEAFARAAAVWPREGVPASPQAWLYRTAHRVVVDGIRAEAVAGRKAALLAIRPGWTPIDDIDDVLPDERLHLILLCCHPALAAPAQAALALRLVIGTPTPAIARLFLVPLPTMAARITRAKHKIVAAGVPLGAPAEAELEARLDGVVRAIYLAFTAGYVPDTGPDLVRIEESGDAVRLAQMLYLLVPKAAVSQALLALVMLQHSRRHARVSDGCLVPLPEQDRARWHHDEIGTALAILADVDEPTTILGRDLTLQARIAAEHARARDASQTNWPEIARLYAELDDATGSMVVRMNRAVAVAEVDGPAAGLDLLAGVDEPLASNHRLWAIRADLSARLGDHRASREHYSRALSLCGNEIERAFLQERRAAIDL